jgi:uncharacterized protein YidB (DUF937 family)
MSLLNEAINAALREHDVPRIGECGMASASSLADALRSLLAPKAAQAGLVPDDTHLEPDALQELISRLEHAGYREVIASWIGEGGNQPIEPQQIAAALGPRATDLSRDSRLPREVLLQQLARLLPAVIDRITPDGKLPQAVQVARVEPVRSALF